MAPSVHLLEVDPDLGGGLDDGAREEAGRAAVARKITVESGEWDPPDMHEPAHLGLLVLDGLMTRTMTVAGRESVELLSRGDLLRPWVRLGPDTSVTATPRWTAVSPTSLAVLDAAFARRIAPWPELNACLMDRLMLRSRLLAFALAISHVRRVDERLLLFLWHLADRWGRVTPDGVSVPLRLTHRELATLIGAQRPSVSTALGNLRNDGKVERREDGSWLLRGDPAEVLPS